MKKQLLLATSLCLTGVLSAQVAKTMSKVPARVANIAAKKINKNMGDDFDPGFMAVTAINNTPKIVSNNQAVAKTSAFSEATVGQTYYDLQSNSSARDFIVVNADGSISTVWTMEAISTATSYPNRGTGYNYFDGSNWGPIPTNRIESVKTGWGEVAVTSSGKEVVMSHSGSTAPVIMTRPSKGTGSWTQANTGGTTSLWPRMVATSTGDTVYAVSNTNASFQGMTAAVVFHRSTDGGVTWGIKDVIPTGMTSAEFLGFGGDAYSIACRGNVVAIVAGDADKDVVMVKSTDGGVTWTPTIVMDCPIDLWDHTTTTSDINNDNLADTLETNDGTYSINIDNNNEVHVSFGRMRILDDDITDASYSYFPGTDGLYYWKEGWGANNAYLVAGIEDLYEQGTIYFPTPSDPNASPWGTFGCSLTSYPSIAFDANNTIYLSYSSIVDSLLAVTNPEKLVRHQYIIKSCDGGINWTAPYDCVGDQGGVATEGVFGALAKRVNGSLHLLYQKDIYPGFGVNSTADADNQGNLNDIVYVNIPLTDLPACPIVTGIKNEISPISNVALYPNPTSNNATVEVSLAQASKMNVVVMNSVGQVVNTVSVNGNTGINRVDLNLSNLTSGLYFYQVQVGDSKSVTKKFVVEK